jgi:transposase
MDYPEKQHQPAIEMHLQTSSPTHANPVLENVPERIREIAMMRGLGYSFRQIAEHFCVTPQAVSLMLARHKATVKSLRGATELTTLSSRAANALGRHRIRSREEARRRDAIALLKGSRNCGRKTISEIERWLDEGTVAR